MGTWGHNSFENDNAGDWIWGLKPAKRSLLGKPKDPFGYPMSAINALLASDLYIEAPEGEEAIAAAECLAAALGHAPPRPPEELTAWVASLRDARPIQDMLDRAIRAIEKVRDDEQSELRQIWSEASPDAQPDTQPDTQWLAALDDLLSRLRTTPAQ